MSYIIEIIPENERKVYSIPGYKEITPSDWVINKEKNIKLFKYWTNVDEPHAKYFAFIYKDEVKKVVLVDDFIDDNTIRWKAYDSLNLTDEMIKELREAMKAYKCFGSPFSIKEVDNVVVDF